MTKTHKKPEINELEALEKKVVKEWKYLSKIKIKDENHLLFASFVLVIMALLVVNTIYIVNKQPSVLDVSTIINKTSKVPIYLSSNQTADNDIYTVSVSNVTASDVEDQAFPLSDGETILSAKVVIKNKTSADKRLSPTQQMYIRSRDGSYYPFRLSSKTSNPLPVEDIKPGQSIEGEISFAIPKTLGDPLLYFDFGWNNTVPTVYDVMK